MQYNGAKIFAIANVYGEINKVWKNPKIRGHSVIVMLFFQIILFYYLL